MATQPRANQLIRQLRSAVKGEFPRSLSNICSTYMVVRVSMAGMIEARKLEL